MIVYSTTTRRLEHCDFLSIQTYNEMTTIVCEYWEYWVYSTTTRRLEHGSVQYYNQNNRT